MPVYFYLHSFVFTYLYPIFHPRRYTSPIDLIQDSVSRQEIPILSLFDQRTLLDLIREFGLLDRKEYLSQGTQSRLRVYT